MSGVKRHWLESFLDDFYMAREFVLASDYERDTQALRQQIEDYDTALDSELDENSLLEAERDELRVQVEAMRAALEKISAYAPCSGVKDPGFTKMYMGILARDAIAAALQEPKT